MKRYYLVGWFLLFGVSAAFAQQVRKGTVSDAASGEPLPFVSVVIKGTQTHTATANDGSFSITVPAAESILQFSSIGYESLEVAAGNGTEALVVKMKASATALNEVVVTGIFNKPRESFTGAAVMIRAEELQAAGNRSVITAIRNIDPSLNIMDNIDIGSDPNRLPTLTMRGASSLPMNVKDLQTTAENMRAANQPLIILNGFEVSLTRMMDMDESLIENITLLKDANATAMYGTRGSNGVIVITTKLPKEGRVQLTYKGSLNIEAPDLTSYNLMNAREKLAFEKAAGLYDSNNSFFDLELKDLYNRRKLEAERGVDTYWLKYPVRTGIGSRHSLNIEGGEQSFRYSAGLAYNNIAGTMKGSDRNTFNGNMLFMYRMDNLTFQNDLQIAWNKGIDSPYGTFGDFGKVNAYYTPYDVNGNVQKILEQYKYTSIDEENKMYNPLYNALLPSRKTNEYLEVLNNFSIEWRMMPELFVRGSMGISARRNRSDTYTSADHTMFDAEEFSGDGFARKGRYVYGTGNTTRYEGQLTLNYSKIFNEVHQFFAGMGGTITQETGEQYDITGEGISILYMDFLGMAKQYLKDSRPAGSESISRSAGVLVNANYTYDRRYFIDLNGKYEGSSKFGSNNRFAPIWSAGVGWNLHQEAFIQRIPAINVARLRLSYGITGSQAFDSYLAQITYNDFGGVSYQNSYGAYLISMGNKDLAWQKTYQYNIGTELMLFNNHLTLNLDYYYKLTKGLLADVNLPTASGFQNYKANVGEVENKGLEANLNVFILRNHPSGWTWSVGGTMAHNANTIKEISNALEAMNNELMEQSNEVKSINPGFLFKEGESINTIYAVKSKGIDPSNGQEVYVTANDNETYEWDARDQVACGVTDPKLNGTVNTSVRYKNIRLSAYFYYRYGGQVYNSALASKVENIYPYDNADKRAYYDRWKNPGDIRFFKSVTDFSTTNATSRFVMDENTFAFQSLSLGYDFPVEWTKKHLGVQYLSVSGSLEDVLYLSTVKRERGLSYPFSRKFSVSLTARF